MSLWLLGLTLTVVAWFSGGALQLLKLDLHLQVLAIGQLLGLLATYAALTQLLLMGRIWWIERAFGLDTLARFHRVNGYVALIGIILHAIVIVAHHTLEKGTNFFAEYLNTVTTYEDVIWASIAQTLFILVVASSIYIARKRLKFESWYFVHLFAYAAIALAALHQFSIGGTFLASTLAAVFWYALYGFVALNLIVWRFGLPIYRYYKYDFSISRIEPETPTVTNVYIRANNLHNLKIIPGQFVLVRIFTQDRWWQEHPFSVSMVPGGDELRLSIRQSGDYTSDITALKAGTKVMISGPLGRFTAEKAVTNKRLFIAGGIGITPLRAMYEEAVEDGLDSILIFANRNDKDVPLRSEVDAIAKRSKRKVIYAYSDAQKPGAVHGRVDAKMIQELVSDVSERDIYICGPPPMMQAILSELTSLGIAPDHIHTEKFALHP